MTKNISKLFGIPSTKEGGISQHNQLVKKLRDNDEFVIRLL